MSSAIMKDTGHRFNRLDQQVANPARNGEIGTLIQADSSKVQ
ncbi:MAG TPA: hypothetical protein VKD72_09945 [Gemmataceae bacterium]|nr:hypothetical protein [Gemmataceae bacterium]